MEKSKFTRLDKLLQTAGTIILNESLYPRGILLIKGISLGFFLYTVSSCGLDIRGDCRTAGKKIDSINSGNEL